MGERFICYKTTKTPLRAACWVAVTEVFTQIKSVGALTHSFIDNKNDICKKVSRVARGCPWPVAL